MFEEKINKKLKPLFVAAFFSSILVSSSTRLNAHEMWIEAVDYSVKKGDKILANEFVGQNFKGNKYAYLSSTYEILNISDGEINKAVKSRLGDIPAVQELSSKAGLHIITAITSPTKLTYGDPKKFAKFLQEDGLQWVFDKHKQRGLPPKGFTEIYRRNAKALIKVGDGKGQDKAFGLPLEWVVETNPYTSQGNIKAQLLWQGKPAADMHVNVFNRSKRAVKNSTLIKTVLRTDVNGVIEIPRANGGLFMINSVKMIEPDNETKQKTGAVWESIWGSLSYEILPKM